MLKKLFGVLAVATLVIAVYPFALAASGHGVDWYWWMSSPPGTRTSAETQHNAMAVQHLMELHPADWGGIWVEGEGLGVNTVTRSVPTATAYLRDLGITGELNVRKVEYSIPELEALTLRISETLGKHWGPVIMLGPVYSRDAVVVEMQWPDPRILGMLRDISPKAVLARWVPGPKPQLVTVSAPITS